MEIKNNAAVPNLQMGDYMNRVAGLPDKKPHQVEEKVLDKNAFLKMFMEQIKNQDPLNPMKNEQFAQQVAMLTQVEQTMNMNKNLEDMIKAQRDPMTTKLQALQMVGKEIKVNRSIINHDQAMASSFEFNLPSEADQTKVEIFNEAGEKIRAIELGARSPGPVNVKWDGIDEEGAKMQSGRYNFKISAVKADGTKVDVPSVIEGKVDGVTSSANGVFLLVGTQKVALADVEIIRNPTETKPAANDVPGTKSEPVKTESNGAAKGVTLPAINLDEKALEALGKQDVDAPEWNELMPLGR